MSTNYKNACPNNHKNESDSRPKHKSLDPIEAREKKKKLIVFNNIANEFNRLKYVKKEIHKTFDSALAELYDRALNKRKRTGESKKSQN